jgi:tetratricopeptide (TPR) repeat protein
MHLRTLNLLARVVLLYILVPCGAHALEAGAEPAPPPLSGPSKAEAAKAHYLRGATLYDQADYATAWLEFTSAYQLVPRTELLFNMARCEVRLGRPREAAEHFRGYLEAHPNDPDADGIRKEIAELKVDADLLARRDAGLAEAPPEPPRAPPRPFPVYGTIAGGATLVFLVATIATLASVSSGYSTLQTACAPNCSASDVSPLQNRATAGYVLLGFTLAGAGVTAGLFTWELRRGKANQKRLRPLSLLAPGAVPLGLGWRF